MIAGTMVKYERRSEDGLFECDSCQCVFGSRNVFVAHVRECKTDMSEETEVVEPAQNNAEKQEWEWEYSDVNEEMQEEQSMTDKSTADVEGSIGTCM